MALGDSHGHKYHYYCCGISCYRLCCGIAVERPAFIEGIFRATNLLRVTIRDIEAVGSILAAAVKAGANNIWGMEYKLADSGVLQSEARTKAMTDAAEKAAELAGLAGLNLGSIVNVEEIGNNYPPYIEGLGGAFSAANDTIAPGELAVSATVRVVYEMR